MIVTTPHTRDNGVKVFFKNIFPHNICEKIFYKKKLASLNYVYIFHTKKPGILFFI